jgi:putative FmdB family regulatory protein
MPIYEYECKKCTHNFDALQKMSEDPLVDCPKCKKKELFKKVSATSFKLKGTGWYETDFKRK